MAYDVQSLVATVRKRAKDTTFDENLIIDYLQEVQDEVLGAHRFNFREMIGTATLTVGNLSHAYPSNLQVLLGLSLTDPDNDQEYRPKYVPYREFDEHYPTPSQAEQGMPTEFTDFARGFYWNRPLDKAYELTLRYIKAPSRLTTTAAVPDIPEEYKGILIYGALARVEEYRDNYDIAALHHRKVEELSEDMLQRYLVRQLISAPKAKFGRR